MPTIAPRVLVAADHPAVAALWHDAWHDAHATVLPPEVVRHRHPASFAERLPPFGSDARAVFDDEGPVAFAAIVGDEIDQFFLARRARGTGLAAALLDGMERELASRGVREAKIECAVGNERARRFYVSRGYVETAVETMPVWMPDGLSAAAPMHLFAKRLEK